MRSLPARSAVAAPTALLVGGLVVLAALFVLALIGLTIAPAPIFVIDAAGAGYCFVALARATRRQFSRSNR